jgi:hypothetical protein
VVIWFGPESNLLQIRFAKFLVVLARRVRRDTRQKIILGMAGSQPVVEPSMDRVLFCC